MQRQRGRVPSALVTQLSFASTSTKPNPAPLSLSLSLFPLKASKLAFAPVGSLSLSLSPHFSPLIIHQPHCFKQLIKHHKHISTSFSVSLALFNDSSAVKKKQGGLADGG